MARARTNGPIERMAHGIAYRLTRRRRRTIGLLITARGLEVSAPRWSSAAEIEAAILEQRAWIIEQTRAAAQRQREWLDLRPGGHLLWRGEKLPIAFRVGAEDRVEITREGCLVSSRSAQVPLAALDREIFRIASRVLPAEVYALAAAAGFEVKHVSLSRAKTLWGSCHPNGRIRLNARLMLLPPRLSRHVIAHELAHLEQLNHSRRFWAVLERLDPDARRHDREIKQYSVLLEPW
ncbi:MAG: M48 family metallopeptidase [Casimicrobiaceae bacterium]|nr:M48 family metallopeptidase [Casimicrobiaceae bacterium]MCX8098505.1 M48 family metallopeptidase [Casimicrobiaceae bacterium]